MSGTPETDAAVMAAGGDWSYPLRECSRRLERERDDAVEDCKNSRQSLGFAIDVLEEAQEKYNNLATEHMLVVNKLAGERDEAVEEVRRLKIILDLIKKEAQ